MWAEVFLLLFFEVLFVGLRVDVFGFGGCARTLHTPVPSQEGRFGRCVLVGNEMFECICFPS